MPTVSFVIPAHNERTHIAATVAHLRLAIEDLGLDGDVTVVNDSSTDETADLARAAGARVIDVEHRQISATRNAGARATDGDILFFVDADTHPPQLTIDHALRALAGGAIAAGARVAWDPATPIVKAIMVEPFVILLRLASVMPGCCIAVRRTDFDAVGGFGENVYAGEEMAFSRALAKRGRLAFVHPRVVTSGRKFREHSVFGHIVQLLRGVFLGLHTRENLPLWYEGGRDEHGVTHPPPRTDQHAPK